MVRSLALALITGCWAVLGSAEAEAAELDRQALVNRAELAAAYIARSQRADGSFAYEYDFALGRYLDDDHIVRQAGAGFGLAEYLATSAISSPRLREHVERAIDFLHGRSISYGGGQVVSGDATLAGAESGATALAILTELNYFEATHDGRYAALRRGWLHGLMPLLRPAGGFAIRPGASEESPFYNGEIWLALARYVRLLPRDLDAQTMLKEAEEYFIQQYTRTPDLSFFHWGLLAAAVRYETTREQRFVEFISMQGWLFTHYLHPDIFPDSNTCADVEGIAAGARALKLAGLASDPGYLALAERARGELQKSLGLQLLPGNIRDRLPGRSNLPDDELARFAGAFLNGRLLPQSRIDSTQHCLSALIKYDALVNAD